MVEPPLGASPILVPAQAVVNLALLAAGLARHTRFSITYEQVNGRLDPNPGPAHTIANLAAVRIGELLGPAVMGEQSKGRLGSRPREMNKDRRSEFRLMAHYRHVVEEYSTQPCGSSRCVGRVSRLSPVMRGTVGICP